MNEGYKIIKGNKVHKTAIINWKKLVIGKGNIFGPYSIIGTDAQWPGNKSSGKIYIGNNNHFREFTTVHLPTKKRGETKIGDKCYFMTMSHIGHDCVIENSVTLSNNVNVAGNTHIMNSSILGLNAIIHQDQIIGSYTMIAMGTNIGKNIIVKPGYIYTGNPPRGIIKNNIGLKRNKITDNKLKKETIRFNKLSNK
ncbi:hypothetical protein OAB97_02650 [Candidatus Pelagibacter sp.]|nr:hypothetical protein [Candidatus Pelagibacter sp.]